MSSNTNIQPNYRPQALIATLLIHAALIAFFMWMVVSKPDPPLTATEGMVVNLGYVDESTGDIQPMSDEVQDKPIVTQEQITASEQAHEKIVTQTIEETEAVKSSENVTETNSTKVDNNPVKEEVKEVQPQVNPMALYKGKKNNSTSQGDGTKGSGDQGDPNGDPFSKNKGVNTGNGNTPGGGGDSKNGISHNLEGRKAQSLIKPQYDCNESGTVVVDIIVDQEGRVIKATAGGRGSTTASTCLCNKAKEAALKAKFSAKADAPEEQRGSIRYTFSLK